MKTNSYLLLTFILVLLSGCGVEDPEFSREMRNGGAPVFSDAIQVSDITASTITFKVEILKENGYKITERGFVWSQSPNPTLETGTKIQDTGTGIGEYFYKLTGLHDSTTYYIRAYAINEKDTIYTGEFSVLTKIGTGSIETTAATVIYAASATVGGFITKPGEGAYIRRGVYYSTSKDFLMKDSVESADSTDIFTCKLSGLTPLTTYYYYAFAENEFGMFDDRNNPDSLTTLNAVLPINNITLVSTGYNDATLQCYVNSNDTSIRIIERGFCWVASTGPASPDIIHNDTMHAKEGPGGGLFTANITNLASKQQYYAKAYALNQFGDIFYSSESITFSTLTDIPIINTEQVTNIRAAQADFAATLINEGKSSVYEGGICWSTTNPLPTISDNKLVMIPLGYRYTGTMNVKEGTRYYYRAYAINAEGPGYGNPMDTIMPSAFTNGSPTFGGRLLQSSNAYFSIDNNLYIVGGDKGPNYSDELYACSIPSDATEWTQLRAISSGPAKYQTAVAYGNGAYVYGGLGEDGLPKNNFMYYDALNNIWQTNTSCPNSLSQAVSFALGNSVFIVGGKNSSDLSQNTVWSFDVSTKQWNRRTNLLQSQYGGMAVVINGVIYAGMGKDSQNRFNRTLFMSLNGGSTWSERERWRGAYTNGVLGAVAYDQSIFFITEEYQIVEFNTQTTYWTNRAFLPLEYRVFNSIYVYNRKIYIGLGTTNSLVIYDPAWDNTN